MLASKNGQKTVGCNSSPQSLSVDCAMAGLKHISKLHWCQHSYTPAGGSWELQGA